MKKTHNAEQIVRMLQDVDAKVTAGSTVEQVCRELGISNGTYYKWRRQYGRMKLDQVKRLKELEKENDRLKKLVAEQALDNAILKEALSGNY